MRWFANLFQRVIALQVLLNNALQDAAHPPVTTSEQWQILGPFTIGTREAAWGADPLEAIGGFHSLQCDTTSRYKSSLAANGTIAWSNTKAQVTYLNNDNVINVELTVGFPDIDWCFLQQVYGWAALQWQGWARGYITVNTDTVEVLNLDLDHILELWIDDVHYFGGDFYGFHNAPILLELSPGGHKIDVRLLRDVRSMGGVTDDPSVDVRLLLTRSRRTLRQIGSVLYPDRLVDWKGPLASNYASVVLRNDNNTDIYIYSLNVRHNTCQAQLIAELPIRLVPGQSRPIAFQIDCIPGTSAHLSIDLHFGFYADKFEHTLFVDILARRPVAISQPHMFTYLHPSGIVSFAVLRPPPLQSNCSADDRLPVLVVLHGAGVDVDGAEARHSLDAVADLCAWTLLPSGVTPWSGDDWHHWGWSDVEAALNAIPAWIRKVEWTGAGVDISRLLITGHSNGGQGVWYAITHHPERIIAAAPISGYSSIGNYVPYTFWQPADPRRTAVVQAQLSTYRHELLLSNAKGIPLFQQHGSADDNVPAYHSRLMYELAYMSDLSSEYVELPGKPHWWEGVMTTTPLADFYRKHLIAGDSTTHSDPGSSFELVTASPSETGGRFGVEIVALLTPGQVGALHVKNLNEECHISPRNIEVIELALSFMERCSTLFIETSLIAWKPANSTDRLVLQRSQFGSWQAAYQKHCRRSGRQHGGLEAILRTKATFEVVPHSNGTASTALQIANNLVQYYSADAAVSSLYADAVNAKGNIISIAVGTDLPPAVDGCATNCHVELHDVERLIIAKGDTALYSLDIAQDEIVAAAYLRPLPDNRLELIFWAIDTASLSVCTRLLPLMTGGGQPDFVIATRQMLAQGLEGVFAQGFFDSSWCPSATSFFATGTTLK